MMKNQLTMRTTSLLATGIVATMMLFALRPSPAMATPQGVSTLCDQLITTLRSDTLDANSLSVKDKGALLLKVDETVTKLSRGKFCDALQKLNDYKAKIDSLHFATKPKISEEDYLTLSGDVDAAIVCVTGLCTPA